jgi:glutaredoxin 3
MSLLKPSKVYKPFQHPWAIDFAIQSDKLHWGEWEAELQDDVKQWKSGIVTDTEKHQLTQIFRLFTQSDMIVGNNYIDALLSIFRNNEVRQMLSTFGGDENVHQRAYALMIDTLGMDEAEYGAFLSNEYMKAKAEFMVDDADHIDGEWGNLDHQAIALTLARSVCNEGMSLFSAFAMLMNYQRFGKMKGMCTIIEWSIRDETLHLQGITKLFQEFCKEHPEVVTDALKKAIYDMYRQAVSLEDKIIDLAFELGPVKGLTADEMKTYIRYVADRRLVGLGLKPNFEIETNPLPWLDWIMSGDSFKNFFEGRVTDYVAGSLIGDWGWNEELPN